MNSVWTMVHAEPAALIEDLAALTPEQWDTPSLCDEWSVHDVAAHLIDSARTTRLGFVVALGRARFDFDRLNQRGVERERGDDPGVTLTRLREVAPRTTTPPAALDTRLVEEIVHGEDIRRPLGLTRRYSSGGVIRALRLQARTPVSFGGAKETLGTIRMTATDADLEVGEGAPVCGPALSLLLAASGRRAALADLEGEGLAALAI